MSNQECPSPPPPPPSVPLEVCRGEKDPHPMLLVTKEAKKAHERPLMRTEGVVKDDPSSALSRVKAFLPGMAAAEQELRVRMEVMGEEERRRAIQVDHVDESCGDAYVEMNVGLVEKGREADWSSDSDPDSPPSPPREGQDNEFTSDSDSDSTISTSTGSETPDEKDGGGRPRQSSSKKRRFSNEYPRKRPLLVEELPNKTEGDEDQSGAKRSREESAGPTSDA